MIEWKRMSKREALVHLHRYDEDKCVPSSMYEGLTDVYRELRERMTALRDCMDEMRKRIGNKTPKDYASDLLYGLTLYRFLREKEFGIWDAADDNVWRYIAVKVMPDIVHERLGGDYAKDAFSGVRSSRFWVRNIWWYIYLSLVETSERAPDYDMTAQILKGNDTDILAGVVDHPGSGFRVELFRLMMREFDAFCNRGVLADTRENAFRYLIKEYQIRTTLVDPDLEGHKLFLDEIFSKGEHLKKGDK